MGLEKELVTRRSQIAKNRRRGQLLTQRRLETKKQERNAVTGKEEQLIEHAYYFTGMPYDDE